MSAPLVVEGLTAAYAPPPAVAAVEGVTFAAEAGTRIAVLGPNGGGKTTLFRALTGELAPRAGHAAVAGALAYAPQTDAARLDLPVSALDVALMGAYGRTPWWRRLARADRARAREALGRLGLGDRAGVRFGALSRGQRQRALVARALVQDAAVLLLDEPFAGVDRPSAERLSAVLEELRDEGRAVLVATHDLEQARGFERVLCLNRRQVAFGPPADALGPAVLEATYGAELVRLDDGGRAIAVQHHDHDHECGAEHDHAPGRAAHP